MPIPHVTRRRAISGVKYLVDGLRNPDRQPGLSFSEVIDGFATAQSRYLDLNFFDAGGTLDLRAHVRSVITVRVELRKTEHLHLASILVDSNHPSERPTVSVSSSWQIYRDVLDSGLLFDVKNRDIALHTKRDSNPWVELQFPVPVDIRNITLRNRNDARSARARGILVSVRTRDGRWTTLYDGNLREREFAAEVERQYATQLLAKRAASRLRPKKADPGSSLRQPDNPDGRVAADLIKLLTLIRLQDLATINRDFNKLGLSDEDGKHLKSLINSKLLAPRNLEWNIHSVRRTFRFWTTKEKQHYIDFALDIIDCLRQLNDQVCFGFGSVLSVVRDHDLIPHDDDLDIIIGFDPNQAATLTDALNLVRTHLNENEFSAYGTSPANLNVRDRTNFKKLDVFVGIFEADKIAWYPGKRGSLTRSMIFPPTRLDLLGRKCPVPRKAEQYLREVYGAGWKTPDANFHHPFSSRKAEYESIQG